MDRFVRAILLSRGEGYLLLAWVTLATIILALSFIVLPVDSYGSTRMLSTENMRKMGLTESVFSALTFASFPPAQTITRSSVQLIGDVVYYSFRVCTRVGECMFSRL